MKYIDAEKLRSEIKRLYNIAEGYLVGSQRQSELSPSQYRMEGAKTFCLNLLAVIDSLQQEQDFIVINKKDWEAQEQFRKNKVFGKPLQQEHPKVDLEREIQNYANYLEENGLTASLDAIAHHFYELGLR